MNDLNPEYDTNSFTCQKCGNTIYDDSNDYCDEGKALCRDCCKCCEPDACIGWSFDPATETVTCYGERTAKAYNIDREFVDSWKIKSIAIITSGEGLCEAMIDGVAVTCFDDREDAENNLRQWMD